LCPEGSTTPGQPCPDPGFNCDGSHGELCCAVEAEYPDITILTCDYMDSCYVGDAEDAGWDPLGIPPCPRPLPPPPPLEPCRLTSV
jgi:hypothetical protein